VLSERRLLEGPTDGTEQGICIRAVQVEGSVAAVGRDVVAVVFARPGCLDLVAEAVLEREQRAEVRVAVREANDDGVAGGRRSPALLGTEKVEDTRGCLPIVPAVAGNLTPDRPARDRPAPNADGLADEELAQHRLGVVA
jgi:hypothetical protein